MGEIPPDTTREVDVPWTGTEHWWRVLPPGMYAGRARVLVERSLLVNRHIWLAVLSGICEPLFFLFALGVGFDGLVGGVTGPDGRPMSYAAYVAPALLAAMSGATHDVTFTVFFKLRYARLYDAMLATSLGPVDVALGEITWATLRGGLYAAGFLTVMLSMGLISSPWALLALPVALLVAFAFAATGMACVTFMRSWQDFDLVNLALLVMFLFSTTFFPMSGHPGPVRIAVVCSPLTTRSSSCGGSPRARWTRRCSATSRTWWRWRRREWSSRPGASALSSSPDRRRAGQTFP